MNDVLFAFSAWVALLPAVLLIRRAEFRKDALHWGALIAAVAGPLAWVVAHTAGGWSPNLASALWITVATTLVIYAVTALVTEQAWRLLPLVATYMACLGAVALVWQNAGHSGGAALPSGWVQIHVALSVATYALATLAALAALSAFLQERALKTKKITQLTRQLPSVSDSESLLVRLLTVGEVALGLGLVSGMASQFQATGHLLEFDHKTLLTLLAFAVIGLLLVAHYRTGIRGRRAARLVLVGYLLLTLGYPGVKFVTDVLLVP